MSSFELTKLRVLQRKIQTKNKVLRRTSNKADQGQAKKRGLHYAEHQILAKNGQPRGGIGPPAKTPPQLAQSFTLERKAGDERQEPSAHVEQEGEDAEHHNTERRPQHRHRRAPNPCVEQPATRGAGSDNTYSGEHLTLA